MSNIIDQVDQVLSEGSKKTGPKHYVLDVHVESHPTGKLKRQFKAGAHPDEASAHKAAHAFYKKKGIKVKSMTTRRAYHPMTAQEKETARGRHFMRTGVSAHTVNNLRQRGML